MGNAYAALNLPQDAMGAYEQAITLRGDYGEAYNNLGNALLERGDSARAIEALRKAVALMPGAADARANLGNAYKAAGMLTAAEEAYRKAIALQPNSAAAYQNLAMVTCELYRIEEAFTIFTKAAQFASWKTIPKNLSDHKMRHDQEQEQWQRSRGRPAGPLSPC